MKVRDYLKEQGVSFSTHEHAPAYTAQEVAAEEHVSGYMLAKTVIVRAGEGFVMCVLPAPFMLDHEKVGELLGVDSVVLADESDIASLFPDSEVGAEPPFGALSDMRTIVDQRLAEDEEIVFQADTHREAVRMAYADYARLAQPTVADIAVRR